MKVGDLIKRLKKFDSNSLVVVSGYEGGYESGVRVSSKDVMKYVSDYCGDYDDYEDYGDKPVRVKAVVIERDSGMRDVGA